MMYSLYNFSPIREFDLNKKQLNRLLASQYIIDSRWGFSILDLKVTVDRQFELQ